jgi:hypothetical protein
MHGKGTFIWKNGQIFEGFYKEDKKDGEGKLQFEDGSSVEGNWIDGKLHGKGKYYNK